MQLRNKQICIFLLSAGIAAMATGCAKKTETVVQSTEATQTTEAVQTSEPVQTSESVAKESEKEKEPEVQGETINIMTGVVSEAGMSTVTITNAKYPAGITFLKEDAATGFADGLLLKQEITIFYRGEVKGTDASAATVELLRDKRSGDEESEAAMVSGKVLGIGMSAVSIETDDGKTFTFEQDPKPVNMTDGPMEGDHVTIIYSYQDEAREGEVVPELIRK
ncbi:MAG: hypothetical protein RSC13_01080 [Clostridium sp.]